MTAAEHNRITSACSSAIEYIQREHDSALARMVITELRAAIALVSPGVQHHADRLLEEHAFRHLDRGTVERIAAAAAERLREIRA